MALVKRITEYRPRHAGVAEIPDPPSTSHQLSNNFVTTQYITTQPTSPSKSQQQQWHFYDVSYGAKEETIRPPSPPSDEKLRRSSPITAHTTRTSASSVGSRSIGSLDDANSLYSHPLSRHTSLTSSSTSVSPNNHYYPKQGLPVLARAHLRPYQGSSKPATSFASFPRSHYPTQSPLTRTPSSMTTTIAHEHTTETPEEVPEPCIPPMVPYSYHPRIYGSAAPPEVYGHSSTTVGSKIYTFGGTNGSQCTNDMYCFNTEARMLTKVDRSKRAQPTRSLPRPSHKRRDDVTGATTATTATSSSFVPSPREFHTGTTKYVPVIPGVPKRPAGDVEIFYFGGGDNIQCFNDSFMYNTRTGVFRKVQLSNDIIPPPRMGHVTVSSGPFFYMHGGHNPFTGETFNDMWRFDPTQSQWSQITYTNPELAHPSVAFHDGCFVARDDTLFYYGGKLADGAVCSQVSQFDPETATWSLLPMAIYNKFTGQSLKVSLGRSGHKVLNGGKWVYILGGENEEGQVTDMWVYSLNTGVLIRSCYYGTLFKGLSHHTVAFCDGLMYFFGGLNTSSEWPEVVCEIRCIELPLTGTCMKEL